FPSRRALFPEVYGRDTFPIVKGNLKGITRVTTKHILDTGTLRPGRQPFAGHPWASRARSQPPPPTASRSPCPVPAQTYPEKHTRRPSSAAPHFSAKVPCMPPPRYPPSPDSSSAPPGLPARPFSAAACPAESGLVSPSPPLR